MKNIMNNIIMILGVLFSLSVFVILCYFIINPNNDNNNNELSNISLNGIKIGDKVNGRMLRALVLDAEFRYNYNQINFDIDDSDNIRYLSFFTTWDYKGQIIKGIDDIKIKYKNDVLKNIDDFKEYFGDGERSNEDKKFYTITYKKNNIKLYLEINDGELINIKLKKEKPTNSQEEGSEIMFDRENSDKVIQEALNCDISDAKFIVWHLSNPKIKGAIKAELVEDDTFDDTPIVLEIESEDHKTYRIYMTKKYSVEMIKDMETGKYVYGAIR